MLAELSTPQSAADWLRARVRGRLTVDSRVAGTGDGFIAWPGLATDGRRFVHGALAQGAAACLVEREGAKRPRISIPHYLELASSASRALILASITFRELWEASILVEPMMAEIAALKGGAEGRG